MSHTENLVPIVPIPIEQVQQVQNIRAGTSAGTAIGTASLKSLAIKRLQEQRQVQPQVQEQVQAVSSCTYPEVAIGTLLGADSQAKKILYPEKYDPTPEQIAHARRMLVRCPAKGRDLHCWYCSRCGDARKCKAWHTRSSDVEFFRQSERPYSLYLVEGGESDSHGQTPDYAVFCASYRESYRNCFTCPDYQVNALRFCGRYNRLHEAPEVVQ